MPGIGVAVTGNAVKVRLSTENIAAAIVLYPFIFATFRCWIAPPWFAGTKHCLCCTQYERDLGRCQEGMTRMSDKFSGKSMIACVSRY